ncbi:hypothetical protein ACF1BE_20000 [Streptomyces sp. NPDC014991]|uniref:hypothetical protein n=1 Tax=Streptomyces sp. NPDC014991 TaxID=3364935 RepID=UPI0036FF1B70
MVTEMNNPTTGCIRPVQYWDGAPVPFITAWSRERIPPQPLTTIHGRGGTGLGFQNEISHVDRHYGVLWPRMPAARGGRPNFMAVHALRQRQAMGRLLCQVCGGPTCGSRRSDERTLFLAAAPAGRQIADGEQTASPPVHAVCARLAVEYCPPLGRGWAAALVEYAPVWGVAGPIYHPQTLDQLPADRTGVHHVPFTDERRIRWVLAARLIVTLKGVTPVTDLDALADEEIASARARVPR